MEESLKNKIKELYESTPPTTGVAFGKKRVGGKFTGENCIIFNVEKKKSLSELEDDEILPSTVNIDGVIYKTDVWESGKIKLLACDETTSGNCYDWEDYPPQNQNEFRPLYGGVQCTSANNSSTYGTLGFMAMDTLTSAIVGVSNNHVLVKNAFYTTSRDVNNVENELSDVVYQNYPIAGQEIGKVIRYVPISQSPTYNQVDGALVGIFPNTGGNTPYIDFTASYKQYGLSYTLPLSFASTGEIDGMLDVESPYYNPPLYSSGAGTGAKGESLCGLTISGTNAYELVGGYNNGGVEEDVLFSDLLSFTRTNPDCLYPIASGDSGSALIADFNGTWKIVGLVFAGGDYDGVACRIDKVASQLGISAWDGSTIPFIDLSSQIIITEDGQSSAKTKTCNGDLYWQIGAGTNNNPC